MVVPRKPNKSEKEELYREAFLPRLNFKLAAPTSEWPTVRCWTEPALNKIFRQIRDELATDGLNSGLSHASLLAWLCRLRLAARLPVEGDPVYLIDVHASPASEINALELLMAVMPSGVICYFSAVVFHNLTTQMVEHHHVAELRPQSPAIESKNSDPQASERPDGAKSVRKKGPVGLGTRLFGFQGIPFYRTRRSCRLIPGVQTRGYGPRTLIRITTLEQTLLDCLYKPFHCGGTDVVFEAWQEAIASNRIDEERLVMDLQAMNFPASTRRVGVMLELMGHTPGVELRHHLELSQQTIDRSSPFSRISILPGVEYQKLNEHWQVFMP
ncbi:MAG: type IV toxin-antitoxin system AbiEi family antitoxin domain-containing protein [Gemmataceae bacterium]